jgi:uncharacterized membrane protein YedE/YeeE
MGLIVSLIAGLLFGVGLAVSGMADPAKVQNFLDLFGSWDPSLAFVMAGAVLTTFVGYRWALRRPAPLLEGSFALPKSSDVDKGLLLGAAVFGIGWGLAGFCPGPAVVSVPLLAPGTVVFVVAMLAGIAAGGALRRGAAKPEPGAA